MSKHRARPPRIEPATPVMTAFEAGIILGMANGTLPTRDSVVERIKTLGLDTVTTQRLADSAIDQYMQKKFGVA